MAETVDFPAFIDVHVHLREPGTNHAETIASGTRAALLGGYAFVVDMPNNPGCPTWTYERAAQKIEIAEADSYIYYGLNAGSQPGKDNIGQLEAMMRLAIGTKGYGGPTTGIERKTDPEAREFEPIIRELARVAPDKPYFFHTGKENLEDMINLVSGQYGIKMHVCHVNKPDQVDLVTKYRKKDFDVRCGVCPHHIFKTSHDRQTQGQHLAMQPPLAEQVDAEKLGYYLSTGAIQSIETDHAPHAEEAKWHAEENGGDCFGVPGIEHAAKLMLYQVKIGKLSIERMVDAMSTQPADLLGIKISDRTYTTWQLESGMIESVHTAESGSGWTPYAGLQTGGRLLKSVIGGRIVYYDGAVIEQQHGRRTVTSRGQTI